MIHFHDAFLFRQNFDPDSSIRQVDGNIYIIQIMILILNVILFDKKIMPCHCIVPLGSFYSKLKSLFSSLKRLVFVWEKLFCNNYDGLSAFEK